MNEHNIIISDERIRELQQIFLEFYDETKEILIVTERYADFTNQNVFYNMFQILDQVHWILIGKNDFEERLEFIKKNFIAAQNDAIITFIAEISKWIDNNNLSKFIQIDYICAKLSKFMEDPKINEALVSTKRLDTPIDFLIKVNNQVKEYFYSVVAVLNPEFKPTSNSYKEGESKSIDAHCKEKVYEILIDNYDVARNVILNIWKREGYYYSFIVTEWRDAVDHITKALIHPERICVEELICASEHIRRGAMEAMHFYAKKKFEEIEKITLNSNKLDRKMINRLFDIKQDIVDARNNKADKTWYRAIDMFNNAIKKMEKIEKELESDNGRS